MCPCNRRKQVFVGKGIRIEECESCEARYVEIAKFWDYYELIHTINEAELSIGDPEPRVSVVSCLIIGIILLTTGFLMGIFMPG